MTEKRKDSPLLGDSDIEEQRKTKKTRLESSSNSEATTELGHDEGELVDDAMVTDKVNSEEENSVGLIIQALPDSLVQYNILPFLPKRQYIAVTSSCKRFYTWYQEALACNSIDYLRLYYLNYNNNNNNNNRMVANNNPVPMKGDVLISLLKDGRGEASVMSHPYLKGMVNDGRLEWLQQISKMDAIQFRDEWFKHIGLSSQNSSQKNGAGCLLLPILFDWNVNNPNKPQFVAAGGSLGSYAHLTKSWSDDVDIFIMENGCDPSESHNALKSVLLKFGEEAEKAKVKYGIIKNNGTLNVHSKDESQLCIQFILRRVNHVEELMTFFDLDCARLAFDGQKLVSTREGIRAHTMGENYVHPEHRYSGMYMKRAVKYGRRDIETQFYVVHPLQHLLSLKEFIDLRPDTIAAYSRNPGEDNEQDCGLYTPAVVLKYKHIEQICKDGLEAFIERDEQNDYDDTYMYVPEMLWEAFRDYNMHDPHVFALTAQDLYRKDLSKFFTEGYFESHLRDKYHIYKCYLCHKYEHVRPILLRPPKEYGSDEDGDEEEEEEDVYDFDYASKFKEVDYDMCQACRELNESKAKLTRDLTGQIAIVTGARIKIGYWSTLKLLRAGATVIATTRFIEDAKKRYSQEEDYQHFKDRLILYPLNLKDGKSILSFVEYIHQQYKRVHILINNAAQTVRRPLAYYRSLINKEMRGIGLSNAKDSENGYSSSSSNSSATTSDDDDEEKNNLQVSVLQYVPKAGEIDAIRDPVAKAQHQTLFVTSSVNLSEEDLSMTNTHLFPPGLTDAYGEQLDTRTHHSWLYKLNEVSDVELLEVQMVNQIAPTMLAAKLLNIMKSSEASPETGYIINVTSHEGQFNTIAKTDNHIHTNISKAGLNMLTRSGAPFYAKNGIIMVSCDTGWVSSAIKTHKKAPLSCEDGASRVLHPIMTQSTNYGILEKDYKQVDW